MGRGPIPTWRSTFLLLGISLLVLYAINRAISYFGFISVAFGCAAYLASNITNFFIEDRDEFFHPLINSIILILVLVIYGVSVFTTPNMYGFIISGILLIILVQFGGYFVELSRNRALERLSKGNLIRISKSRAYSIESLFTNQSYAYVAIPVGTLCGLIIGDKLNLSQFNVSILVLQCIFILLSLSLFFLLCINFIKLSKPLIDFQNVSQPIILREQNRIGLLSKLTQSVIVFKTSDINNSEFTGKTEQDVACAISDLRKIYLYNSLHNTTIWFVLSISILSLSDIKISSTWLVGGFFLALILFTQLPYVLGQTAMHEKMAEVYEGVQREKLKEDLRKYAPLFPAYHSLIALTASGTAGGVMYFLLDNVIKELFKK